MPPKGKNINLFLMDNEPSRRIKCTLANWTGVAYKTLASNLVIGGNANGLLEWKTTDGKTLK